MNSVKNEPPVIPAIDASAKNLKGKIVHKDILTKSSLMPNLVTRFNPTFLGFFFLSTAMAIPLIIINKKKERDPYERNDYRT